jgi:hypothetical protein
MSTTCAASCRAQVSEVGGHDMSQNSQRHFTAAARQPLCRLLCQLWLVSAYHVAWPQVDRERACTMLVCCTFAPRSIPARAA